MLFSFYQWEQNETKWNKREQKGREWFGQVEQLFKAM
jgi:hypothetical protein